ncbi:FIG00779168: hypothetical protein [hydrothermal vent metagenome]|uniref:TauD/TfdA-like domain-containing protein n=1 Tax=hydrothermal vent metagenome TaxID=652676 RepID=A0A3B0TZY8_9ZZZZ
MEKNLNETPQGFIWDLSNNDPYLRWREQRLEQSRDLHGAPLVEIRDLANPSAAEKGEIVRRCVQTNMALYQATTPVDDPDQVRIGLRGFAASMGLEIAETHRSAGKSAIVALTYSQHPEQKNYIPYSHKPINWHTDGYYNGPDRQIRAMVLHCFRPAAAGGQNQLLDTEIAYIRLRDHNPEFIAALMHPQAMTIPENMAENGTLRPVSVGPVFSIDPAGNLIMRYTARTRSISWRQDETTLAAVAFLHQMMEKGDDLIQTITLEPGQGVLCNNSLHNRSGFEPKTGNGVERMMFRVRFHNRIKGS